MPCDAALEIVIVYTGTTLPHVVQFSSQTSKMAKYFFNGQIFQKK